MPRPDFAYPWWLSYGHIVILLPSLAAFFLARYFHWSRTLLFIFAALVAWSGASLLVLQHLNLNGRAELPTENFLASGRGRVLDIGAGTGRSSIMVLEARPNATLVASDLFGDSFKMHFGAAGTPQQRLLANLKAAGVDRRATIATADMLHLPFETAGFDAIVSAYAMEHVGNDGSKQALAEAARVLKPGGDFLLILVANDGWTTFAFGPLLHHAGLHGVLWWTTQAHEAGFAVAEHGRVPASLYFLLRHPSGQH